MPQKLARTATGRSLVSLLLLTFVVRSLIPMGFMPSGQQPFALEICPDGFPAHVLLDASHPAGHAAHTHPGMDGIAHSGNHQHSTHKAWSTHCAFAAVAYAPPASHPAGLTFSGAITTLPVHDAAVGIVASTRHRIAQPRAPPSLAI
jgi:hypothetical protein